MPLFTVAFPYLASMYDLENMGSKLGDRLLHAYDDTF